MVFEVFGDTINHKRTFVPATIYIGRLHVEYLGDVGNIAKVVGQNPIVVGTVEICLGGIPLSNFGFHIHSPLVVGKEVVGPTDTFVGTHPNRVEVANVGCVVAATDGAEGGGYGPRCVVGHNFSDVQPIGTLHTGSERIGHTFQVVLALPEVLVGDGVELRTLQEVVITTRQKCYCGNQ